MGFPWITLSKQFKKTPNTDNYHLRHKAHSASSERREPSFCLALRACEHHFQFARSLILCLVRSMQARAILLWLYLCSSILADPMASTNGALPRQDIQEICAVVRAATSDPIDSITQLSANEHVPGSVPYETVKYSKDGTKRITMYQRTDLVTVLTGPRRGNSLHSAKNWWQMEGSQERLVDSLNGPSNETVE